MKSAALIVIADEILTGKVRDENIFAFTQAMFERGVKVERIFIIPDDVLVIAQTVRDCAPKYTYVFSSGGVGPTHDDKTFLGIAKAFDLELNLHQEARVYFEQKMRAAGRGEVASEAQLKMLRLPTPCEVHYLESLWLPLVVVKNVYIFPGVPYLFEKMLKGFLHLFEADKFYRQMIYTDESENEIAWELLRVQEKFPSVAIGSYPEMPGVKDYRVMVSIEGRDEEMVAEAVTELLPLIAGRKRSALI